MAELVKHIDIGAAAGGAGILALAGVGAGRFLQDLALIPGVAEGLLHGANRGVNIAAAQAFLCVSVTVLGAGGSSGAGFPAANMVVLVLAKRIMAVDVGMAGIAVYAGFIGVFHAGTRCGGDLNALVFRMVQRLNEIGLFFQRAAGALVQGIAAGGAGRRDNGVNNVMALLADRHALAHNGVAGQALDLLGPAVGRAGGRESLFGHNRVFMVVRIQRLQRMAADVGVAGGAENAGAVALGLAGGSGRAVVLKASFGVIGRIERVARAHFRVAAFGALIGVGSIGGAGGGNGQSVVKFKVVAAGGRVFRPKLAAVRANVFRIAGLGAGSGFLAVQQNLCGMVAEIDLDRVIRKDVRVEVAVVIRGHIEFAVDLLQTVQHAKSFLLRGEARHDRVVVRKGEDLLRRGRFGAHVIGEQLFAVGIDDLAADGRHLCVERESRSRSRVPVRFGIGRFFGIQRHKDRVGVCVAAQRALRQLCGSRRMVKVIIRAADLHDLGLGRFVKEFRIGRVVDGLVIVRSSSAGSGRSGAVGAEQRFPGHKERIVVHLTGDVIDGIVKGHVHIVPFAVQLHLAPAVVAGLGAGGDVIVFDAEQIEHPAVGHRVALANRNVRHKRAVGVVGIRGNGVRRKIVVIICDQRRQTVVQQQAFVIVAQIFVVLDAVHQLEDRFFAFRTLCGVRFIIAGVIHFLDHRVRVILHSGERKMNIINAKQLRVVVDVVLNIVPVVSRKRNCKRADIHAFNIGENDAVHRGKEVIPRQRCIHGRRRLGAGEVPRRFDDHSRFSAFRADCRRRGKARPHHQQAKQNGKDRFHFFHGSFLLRKTQLYYRVKSTKSPYFSRIFSDKTQVFRRLTLLCAAFCASKQDRARLRWRWWKRTPAQDPSSCRAQEAAACRARPC